jgi:signal transduction histidine kinase
MTETAIPQSPMTKAAPRTERERTDESLAGERAKTDAALTAQTAIEKRADDVLDLAREEADEVLATARDKADRKLEAPLVSPRVSVEDERAREDQAVEDMRAKADETLRVERAANARLLVRLLPLERGQTDKHLLTERARSDAAVTNRDDFLGMVSHDLRDLLSSIAVSTSVIALESGSGEAGKNMRGAVERIERAAGRMNRLIGDLVDVTAIESGKLTISPALSNVSDVIREAIETWEPHARARGVTLEARSIDATSSIFDRERILQVLGNLITNAIKFSPSGGTISVGARADGADLRFSVTDSGSGIPADKLEAIFERFWQVGKNDRRGLGLGLYISQCLVGAHGGRIWVESELGGGSAFHFSVPASA